MAVKADCRDWPGIAELPEICQCGRDIALRCPQRNECSRTLLPEYSARYTGGDGAARRPYHVKKLMQPYIQRIIGLICLVIGVLLMVHGHDMAQSIGSQVQQVFTGAPSNRSTYFYIAGVVLVIFGASQIVWPAKPK